MFSTASRSSLSSRSAILTLNLTKQALKLLRRPPYPVRRASWDKSSEGGSMMNEPAVESGRTMEALRAQARGGPEKLIYERVLPPSPGIGDVLLKVRAASFIPTELDWSSTWVD